MRLWDESQIIWSSWSAPWLHGTYDEDYGIVTLWFGVGPFQFRKFVGG